MVAVMNDGAKSDDRFSAWCMPWAHWARGRQIVRIAALLAAAAIVLPSPAVAQKVRITGLADVNFGTLTNLGADALRSQNVCLFSQGVSGGYNVRANGSGAGGAFTLANGGSSLVYEVQWNQSSGQSSGTTVAANSTLSGLTSIATQQTCNSGPPTTASLIILLRSAALSSATAGAYSGTLTLIVAPE